MNIDTANYQCVTALKECVVVINPRQKMTKNEAMQFAAWVAVMAEMLEGETPTIEQYMEAIKDT